MKKVKTYHILSFIILLTSNCSYLYHNTKIINENKIYGKACSAIGKNPEFRSQIETSINEVDIETLNSWLNSLSIIKKTYAAEAFIRLHNDNKIKLSDSQKRKINRIKKSNRKINNCWGCIYSYDKVKNLLSDFELK